MGIIHFLRDIHCPQRILTPNPMREAWTHYYLVKNHAIGCIQITDIDIEYTMKVEC